MQCDDGGVVRCREPFSLRIRLLTAQFICELRGFIACAAVRDYDSQLIVLGWLEDQNAAGVRLLIKHCGEFAQ